MDKEKMININAALLEESIFSAFEKDGEEVQVANFTVEGLKVQNLGELTI